jgi:hypothetical protein
MPAELLARARRGTREHGVTAVVRMTTVERARLFRTARETGRVFKQTAELVGFAHGGMRARRWAMIQVPAQASVFVVHEPVSFRNGIDGMAAVARVVLAKAPMSGAFFVFRNRGRHMLRILFSEGGGFLLCTRRLSKGTFTNWPTSDGGQLCSPLLARDLQVVIWGGDPSPCSFPDLWRKVA